MKISALILSSIIFLASPAFATYSLPSDRSVVWTGNAGVAYCSDMTYLSKYDCEAHSGTWTVDIPSFPNDKNAVTDYGADNTGTTDATSAINNCLSGTATQKACYLPAGSYLGNGSINIPSKKALRGAGISSTTIILGVSGRINLGNNIGRGATMIVLTSGYTKGSTSVVANSVTGLSVGDFMMISQENDQTVTTVSEYGVSGPNTGVSQKRCSNDHANICYSSGDQTNCTNGGGTCEEAKRTVGQIVVITGISGSTISFEPPLSWNYLSGADPRYLRYGGLSGGIYRGLESVKVTQSSSTSPSWQIDITGGAYCWIKDSEFSGFYGRSLQTYAAFRTTVRSNYYHDATNTSANHGYSNLLFTYSTANLFEDNVFKNVHEAISFEGGGTLNVVAYNYGFDFHYQTEDTNQHGSIPFHSPHPHFNLVEGNDIPACCSDGYWGSSSHNVAFRNRLSLYESGKTINTYMRLEKKETYYSFIGNILGVDSWHSSGQYEYYNQDGSCASVKAIWMLGYYPYNPSCSAYDSSVRDTLLRHANYDYYNDAELQNGSDDMALPNSLYLASKPAWYGSATWPPFDPSGPTIYDIPAKIRYEASGSTHTVGGSISGLTGTVQLYNVYTGGNEYLSRSANGSFTFLHAFNSGDSYSVTVSSQPAGQTCTVTNGSGTVSGNVTNVNVTCYTNVVSTGTKHLHGGTFYGGRLK